MLALNIKRPVRVRKFVLRLTERVLTTPFIGQTINLLQFFLAIAIITFVNASADVYRSHQAYK